MLHFLNAFLPFKVFFRSLIGSEAVKQVKIKYILQTLFKIYGLSVQDAPGPGQAGQPGSSHIPGVQHEGGEEHQH